MPNPEQLSSFVSWYGKHITGDEKGQAQIFLGGSPEFRVLKSTENRGGTSFADYGLAHRNEDWKKRLCFWFKAPNIQEIFMTHPSHEPRTQIFAFLLLAVLTFGLYSPPECCAVGGNVFAWGNSGSGETQVPPGLNSAVDVACGQYFSMALKADGTIATWGDNGFGLRNVPAEATNVIAIATRGYNCLALRRDGSLLTWGAGPSVPSTATNIVAIAVGGDHHMALREDDELLAWGANNYGQCNIPPEATNLIAIAAGYTHSIALRKDGRIFAWGENIGGATDIPLEATNITAISAGPSFNLALRKDGKIFAWGLDWGGNLDIPPGTTNIAAITAGGFAGYGIQSNGIVTAWGRNDSGQLDVPAGLTPAYQIAAGDLHALGIHVVGAVSFLTQPTSRVVSAGDSVLFNIPAIGQMPVTYQWRSNGLPVIGETSSVFLAPNLQQSASFDVVAGNGFGTITSQVATITVIPSAPVITRPPLGRAVSIGEHVTFSASAKGSQPIHFQWQRNGEDLSGQTNSFLVLTNLQSGESGTYRVMVTNAIGSSASGEAPLEVVPVFAWGDNSSGVLDLPFGLTNVTAVSAGHSHNIALKADGIAAAWGIASGYGETTIPPAATNVIAVTAGEQFSAVLRQDGAVVAWGNVGAVPLEIKFVGISASFHNLVLLKEDGTIYNGPVFATNVVAIAAGARHSLALQTNGNLLVWGNQPTPVGASNLLAISAGDNFSLALRDDGTILAWGSNSYGQTNVPLAATNIVAISAGSSYAMALRDDGRILVWGNTNFGLGNIPDSLSFASAISAGNTHNLALKGTGELQFIRTSRTQTISAGSRLALSAWASGEGPVTYQWARNGTNIIGATNAYFLVANAQDLETGDYSVVAMGGQGSITSNIVPVTIEPSAPLIVQQPTNRLVLPGSSTSFTVSAQGTAPLSYQWMFNNAPVPNATNSSLIFTNVQLAQRGDYHVVITNVIGATTSLVAKLEAYPLNVAPVFTNTSVSWSADWGDFNKDGRLDLLVSGKGGGQPVAVVPRLFRNDGDAGFSEVNAGLNQTAQNMSWGDFDNDGNLDILYSNGSRGNIFRNNGNGTFTNLNLQYSADNNAVPSSVDFNNDGLLDFSLGGRLYRNLGGNKFTNVISGLPITEYSTTAWGDYDGDGFQDVLLCGLMTGSAQTRLYRNLGNGTFTNINAGFTNIYRGAGIWMDFNADGKPDILMSGEKGTGGGRFAGLYRNNGDGTFTMVPSETTDLFTVSQITSFSVASLAAGDYDNDGQPDVFWGGHNRTNSGGWLYRGQTNGSFLLIDSPFETNLNLTAAWGDYDADGRLDIAVQRTVSGQARVTLYRNDATETNVPPLPPGIGSVEARINRLQFSWDAGGDAQTPQSSLSYNLRVGRTPGGNDVLSANASPSGFRRVARVGNAGHATSLTLTNLPFGRYYWAAQTVDSAFAGSAFTPEQIFDYAAATLPATGVTSSAAVLNGMFDTNRLPALAWFEWGTSTNYGNLTPQQLIGTNAASALVSASLTNLLADSSYYFRMVVTNADGLHSGGSQAFITTGVPEINPLAATSITASNAVLNAEINPSGALTWASFEYGLTTAYGSSTVMTNLGLERSFVPLSQSITGLIGGQVYHYRVVATNSAGAAVSEDLTFTTSTEPEATSLAASDIGPVSATLNAFVRPNTLLTTAFFEYGTKTNLGSATSSFTNLSGTNLVAVAVPLDGLTRLTDYYFRVVASNASGITRGAILSFTTTNDVFALPPTDITMNGATLNGSVNPNGLQTSVVFEYGTSTNLGSTSSPISLTNGAVLLPVSYPLSNFPSNTTYYFRVVATNAEGIRASTLLSFQTLPLFSVLNPGLSGVNNGSAAWGDYDNDGKLDLLIASQSLTRIYKNLGNGNFSTVSTTIQGTTPGHVEWGDYNNDGWLDVMITGTRSFSASSRIYRNNGNGTFTDIQATLEPLLNGVARWGDFNRDGRADVLLVGQGSSQPVAKIYRNDGNGSFTDMAIAVPAYEDSHALTVDYDNDGNLDLLLMGRLGIQYADVYAKLYRNLGNWIFQDSGVDLLGVRLGFSDAGDFDANGFPDLLYGGEGTNRGNILCLFQNNGNGTFTNVSSSLPQFAPDAGQWGDYDNDGKLDILIRGQKYYSSIVPSNSYSAVLRNMGSNTFVTQNFPLPEIWSSAGGWADYDNDGRLDAVITGNSRTGTMLRFYRNNGSITNSRPSVPRQLASVIESNVITFNWQRGTDIETAANGLTHNLRVGRTPGGNEILSSLSGTNGTRKTVGRGNVGGAGESTLTNAAPGQYYWSIQAIDAGFAGSEFADEQFFSIPGAPIATTSIPTNITTTTTTFRGSIVPNGVETTVHFDWGTSTNLGFATEPLSLPGDFLTNNVNTSLTNLQPGASYFYRIAASNAFGLAHGQILSFTTVTPPTLSARILGGTLMRLEFTGVDGALFQVFASTNLVDWIHVGDATKFPSGVFRFTDTDYTNHPTRFYRVGTP